MCTVNEQGSGQPQPRAFDTPPGGIMTEEAGAITGPVEARIDGDRVRIKYAGAAEEYTVNGRVQGRTPEEVWRVLSEDPGTDEYDNPRTVELG